MVWEFASVVITAASFLGIFVFGSMIINKYFQVDYLIISFGNTVVVFIYTGIFSIFHYLMLQPAKYAAIGSLMIGTLLTAICLFLISLFITEVIPHRQLRARERAQHMQNSGVHHDSPRLPPPDEKLEPWALSPPSPKVNAAATVNANAAPSEDHP